MTKVGCVRLSVSFIVGLQITDRKERSCHLGHGFNPLGKRFLPKITVLTVQSAFLAAMTLNGPKLAKKAGVFFTKKIDFPKIRYKIVQYFNSVLAHKPKFGLKLSLPLALHILSGCQKKLGINYGQSLEMDLDQI